MRSNRDEVRLRHMLDHAREAIAMAGDHSEADLAGNRMLELSLVRLVEIIGEAAARVSDETRERHAQVPWPLIVSMRNRLIHGYDEIDMRVLWETVTTDLPALVADLERALSDESL